MQPLDLLIVVVVVAGAVRGLMTGAVRQVLSLVGLILAIAIAVQWMDPVGPVFGGLLGATGTLATAIGFFLLFVLVQIAVFFAVRGAETLMRVLKLSTLNRMAGGLTGGLKAALLLSALFLVLGPFQIPKEESRSRSQLYAPVASAVPVTWGYLADRLPVFQDATGRLFDRLLTAPDAPSPDEPRSSSPPSTE